MKTTTKVKFGAGFLRDCVSWLNDRDEVLNEGKTPRQLINEFKKGVNLNWYNL